MAVRDTRDTRMPDRAFQKGGGVKYIVGQTNGRTRAIDAIRAAEMGTVIEVGVVGKTREQEERYHAMIGDIAKGVQHINQNFDAETWKRLLIDQFKRDTLKEPQCCAEYWARNQLSVIPSLDGSAVVVLGEQSRRFPKAVASVFVEWMHAWGADHSVIWTDPTIPPVEVYER